MVVDWFCNPGVVVRFHQGAPRILRQYLVLLVDGNRARRDCVVFTKVTKKQELVGPVGSGKVLLAARVAEGQKLVFEFNLVCQRRVILHYS